MKILYVATVRSHIGQFHMPIITALKEAGHEVHAAYKDNSADKKGLDLSIIDKVFEIPFERSPFSKSNTKAYKELKRIIETEKYDIIHCHTPVGGVVTRLAARKLRKCGTKVFYTAHGFHFYKGATAKNWMLFFPVEKLLSKYTDVLVTINEEDFELANSKKFKAGKIVKLNGVGVDLSKFSAATEEEKAELRRKHGYAPDDFIMLYAADLSQRKNQTLLFNAISAIANDCPGIKLLLPGQPILKKQYECLCKELKIDNMVELMGYRRDIDELLGICDVVVSSSRQEGLPLNLIEAAARGKYIISTDVRGSRDVVKQAGYGVLVHLNDANAMAAEIKKAYNGEYSGSRDISRVSVYDNRIIVKQLMDLYFSDC